MIIKKRNVYLDAPYILKSEEKTTPKKDETQNTEELAAQIIKNAQQEASAIIEQAQNQAQQIIFSAQSEAEMILQESQERAKEILNNAKTESEQLITELNSRINAIAESFGSAINDLVDIFAEKLTTVTKIVIEKFLEKEIDEKVTERKMRKVLDHIVGSNKVILRINPQELKLISDEVLESAKIKGITIVPDTTIKSGVIAETTSGNIDTTLNFQFTLLDEIFEGVLGPEEKIKDIGTVDRTDE